MKYFFEPKLTKIPSGKTWGRSRARVRVPKYLLYKFIITKIIFSILITEFLNINNTFKF